MPCASPFAIITHFENLTDPRVKRTQVHKLLDILVIAPYATICGRERLDRRRTIWPDQTAIGLPNSWNCPAGSRRTTPSAVCSRCSIRPSSTPASAVGSVRCARR